MTGRTTAQRPELVVRWALARLPDKQRIAVLLHKYQRMSLAQIAAILSITASDAKLCLLGAYELLRDTKSPIL
ncbi:MAG: hypothetical protein JST28_03415 [Acidobacteria bacterium]|nr:hypothetical protein [Acidobacteriota bacterium]